MEDLESFKPVTCPVSKATVFVELLFSDTKQTDSRRFFDSSVIPEDNKRFRVEKVACNSGFIYDGKYKCELRGLLDEDNKGCKIIRDGYVLSK